MILRKSLPPLTLSHLQSYNYYDYNYYYISFLKEGEQ
jgi:hypothetical protein